MIKKIIFIYGIVFHLAIADNFLVNPSFESGFTGWNKGWYPTFAGILNLQTPHSYSGNYGMYLYTDGQNLMDTSFSILTSNSTTLTSGKSASAHVWVKTTAPSDLPVEGRAFLQLQLFQNNQLRGSYYQSIGQSELSDSSHSSWEQLLNIKTCEIPDSATTAVLSLGLTKSPTQDPGQLKISFDDASLDTVSSNCAIESSPTDTIVNEGSAVTFRSSISGENLQYAWYRNGILIQNATDTVLNLNYASRSDSGSTFSMRIISSNGWIQTSAAVLHVNPKVGLDPIIPPDTISTPTNALEWLIWEMDKYHKMLDVYSDADAAGNHFLARGRMSSPGDGDLILPMVENWTNNPRSGITAIRCELKPNSNNNNWGGWYFQNGVLTGNDLGPRENWGDVSNSGFDLTGAKKISFWARGDVGGEVVEFFAFGVGHNTMPFPGSSPKKSFGWVTLTNQWQYYEVSLDSLDMSYVLGGFGWASNIPNNNNQGIIFYLDDIQHHLPRLTESRFLVSFLTQPSNSDFDMVLRNTAFIYDQALALLAFQAHDLKPRIDILSKSLIATGSQDRFFTDGRIRNAVKGGDAFLPPGWTPNGKNKTIAMPGWYCDTCTCNGGQTTGCWMEDEFQVSTHTGNVAYLMLGMLTQYQLYNDSSALDFAIRMGDWLEQHCKSDLGSGGYTGGYKGWEPSPVKLTYKSTEHNIDLYPAFERLFIITHDSVWHQRALHAESFIHSMWDSTDGKFWTGTGTDGITTNTGTVPLDVNPWAVLALKERGEKYWRSLDFADTAFAVLGGYDFNQDKDGAWPEGTSQMWMAHDFLGHKFKADSIKNFLESLQDSTGYLPSADRDSLSTGFDLSDGSPWMYFNRAHVGATAWFELAKMRKNIYWFGNKDTLNIQESIGGKITLQTDSINNSGFPFKVVAMPDSGYSFSGWESIKGEMLLAPISEDTALVYLTGHGDLKGIFDPDSSGLKKQIKINNVDLKIKERLITLQVSHQSTQIDLYLVDINGKIQQHLVDNKYLKPGSYKYSIPNKNRISLLVLEKGNQKKVLRIH